MRTALAAAPVREGTRRTSFTAPLPREIETAPNDDTIPGTPRGREPAALGPRSRGGVSSRRQVDGIAIIG